MAQHGASEQGSEITQHRHWNARAAASKGHSLVVSMELGRPLWLGLEVAWPWLADSADSAPGPLSASEEARLLVPTEFGPKGANTVLTLLAGVLQSHRSAWHQQQSRFTE
jgi:hypothetical protein